MSKKEYFKVKDVAEKFGCCVKTVYNWISEGKFKAYNIGGLKFLKISEVEDFINQNMEDK